MVPSAHGRREAQVIVRLSRLSAGDAFVTIHTRRPGYVRSVPLTDKPGIWVDLESPDERKNVHMDVFVETETVH